MIKLTITKEQYYSFAETDVAEIKDWCRENKLSLPIWRSSEWWRGSTTPVVAEFSSTQAATMFKLRWL